MIPFHPYNANMFSMSHSPKTAEAHAKSISLHPGVFILFGFGPFRLTLIRVMRESGRFGGAWQAFREGDFRCHPPLFTPSSAEKEPTVYELSRFSWFSKAIKGGLFKITSMDFFFPLARTWRASEAYLFLWTINLYENFSGLLLTAVFTHDYSLIFLIQEVNHKKKWIISNFKYIFIVSHEIF